MSDVEFLMTAVLICFVFLFIFSVVDDILKYRALKSQVDDLEKQIAHISKTSA